MARPSGCKMLLLLLPLVLAGSVDETRTARALLQRKPPSPRRSPPPPVVRKPPPAPAPASPPPAREQVTEFRGYDDLASFNLGMGTQQVNPKYGFTGKSAIVEALEVVQAMGSNLLKLNMDITKYMNTVTQYNGIDFAAPTTTLTQTVSQHPDMVQVFDAPGIKFLFLWAYTRANMPLQKTFEAFEANGPVLDEEYRQFFDLTTYLMTRYKGTGKTFFLGNWEGDWHILSTASPPTLKNARAHFGMIDWYNARARAIDDAKRNMAASGVTGVEVYHYIEINQPRLAMYGNSRAPCIVNLVLPAINPDFISYSAYDALARNENPWGGTFRAAVQFLQGRVKPRTLTNNLNPSRPAPYASRVFIGEYGLFQGPQANNPYSPQQAAQRASALARIAFDLNVPFILYWQLYNNEVSADGIHRGWWLIDNQNQPQPVYYLHQRFLEQARAWVTQFKNQMGRVPTPQEFRPTAISILNSLGY